MWSSTAFRFLRCVGFYPIAYSPNSNSFIVSNFLLFLNCLSFLSAAFGVFHLVPSFDEDSIFIIINQGSAYISFAALASITISPIFYRSKICTIFNSLIKIDNLLKKIFVFPDNKKPGKYAFIVLGLSLGYLAVIGICVEIYFPAWSLLGYQFWVYQVMCLLYPLFLTNFFYLTYHLKTRFEVLNNELEKMMESSDQTKLFDVSFI